MSDGVTQNMQPSYNAGQGFEDVARTLALMLSEAENWRLDWDAVMRLPGILDRIADAVSDGDLSGLDSARLALLPLAGSRISGLSRREADPDPALPLERINRLIHALTAAANTEPELAEGPVSGPSGLDGHTR